MKEIAQDFSELVNELDKHCTHAMGTETRFLAAQLLVAKYLKDILYHFQYDSITIDGNYA